MWYPATTTVAPTDEPVTVVEAKRRLRILFDDDDVDLSAFIASARDHVEKYCNIRLTTQTVVAKCDDFADLARVPDAPLQSVTSISYVATDGTDTTLPTTVYEARADGLEVSVGLKYGQTWPAKQPGSRITVTSVVGFAEVPASIKHAILVFIGEHYEIRENAKAMDWTAFDSLLANYRRGA